MSQENKERLYIGNKKRNHRFFAVLLIVILSVSVVTLITIIPGFKLPEMKPPETKSSDTQSNESDEQYNLPTNPSIIKYAVEGEYVVMSLAEVQSKGYVIFDYAQADETIPIMAYVAPSGKILTAIRFCTPCESKSFWFDKDQTVCDLCGTRWSAETFSGINGPCAEDPPAIINNKISGSSLMISLSSIQALKPQEQNSDNSTGSGSAVKLILVVPSAITQGEVTPFKVKAIDEKGKFDPLRDDVIKVSIIQGNAMLRDPASESEKWSREVTVKMTDGIATVEIFDAIFGISKLSAVWVSGQSYLESTSSGVICVGQH